MQVNPLSSHKLLGKLEQLLDHTWTEHAISKVLIFLTVHHTCSLTVKIKSRQKF